MGVPFSRPNIPAQVSANNPNVHLRCLQQRVVFDTMLAAAERKRKAVTLDAE